jgi:hypothetical protein
MRHQWVAKSLTYSIFVTVSKACQTFGNLRSDELSEESEKKNLAREATQVCGKRGKKKSS